MKPPSIAARLMLATVGAGIPSYVISPGHSSSLGFTPPGERRLKNLQYHPLKKCLLKDCQKMTQHNGGYCCAEHCKKDRKK